DFVLHMFHLVARATNVKMRTLSHCVSAHVPLGSRDQVPAQVHHGPMLEMLQNITAQRCKDWGGERLEFNGEGDHGPVALPPNLDLSRFVNNLKTTSSRLVRREFANQLRRKHVLVPSKSAALKSTSMPATADPNWKLAPSWPPPRGPGVLIVSPKMDGPNGSE